MANTIAHIDFHNKKYFLFMLITIYKAKLIKRLTEKIKDEFKTSSLKLVYKTWEQDPNENRSMLLGDDK